MLSEYIICLFYIKVCVCVEVIEWVQSGCLSEASLTWGVKDIVSANRCGDHK